MRSDLRCCLLPVELPIKRNLNIRCTHVARVNSCGQSGASLVDLCGFLHRTFGRIGGGQFGSSDVSPMDGSPVNKLEALALRGLGGSGWEYSDEW